MNGMPHTSEPSRRGFIGGTVALGTCMGLTGSLAAQTTQGNASPPPERPRKLKLGLIGCGGRGPWLAEFFRRHGGFELHAVADYFPEKAEKAGDRFGVDKARRFSGLHGYQRLVASGVEAVAVVNVPRFHPEHARVAVEAGCHVFVAKPVAVDAPGAMKFQAVGKMATQKKLCCLVDYQMWTDPINIEVVKRIHEGGLGKLGHIDSVGISPPWGEPPIKTAEDRLRWWHATTALSGDVITENTVHSINAVLWAVGRRPISAIGRSRVCRSNPVTEFREVYLVTYEFEDGLVWTHRCQSLRNQLDWALKFDAYGDKATALISYRGKSHLRGGPKHYGGGEVLDLYDQGAIRNIAAFYDNILQGRFDNPSAQQAGDDALTAALGREACARRTMLTMEELIRENRELPFDLGGLRT